MRWKVIISLVGIAGVSGLLGLMGVAYLSDEVAGEKNLAALETTPALIARGEYLAKLGDCAACHSVPGRPAFAGGLRMAIPIGAIYTTNISPDPEYGIGRFEGVVRESTPRGEREYLDLQFSGTDRLKVPTDKLDRVTKYRGMGETSPALSRLGTQEWTRTKARVKESVEAVAKELLELYRYREKHLLFLFR